MKRFTPIRSITSLLVIVALLASIVCATRSSPGLNRHALTYSPAKPGGPSKAASQLPEKLESENDYKPQHVYFFIQHVAAFDQATYIIEHLTGTNRATGSWSARSGIPLYLMTRTLVI